MFPGFSGGPLVNADTHVVGLTSSGLVNGLSLAVPAPTVRQTLNAILEHGRVRRGYLGIGAQSVRLPEALSQQLGQAGGLLLMSVEPDGPAGRSGLFMGDTLVRLNGKPIGSLEELLTTLSGDLVGRQVPVRIVRGGQVRDVEVVVGERN
jgi:S1-C subfamily serine protease